MKEIETTKRSTITTLYIDYADGSDVVIDGVAACAQYLDSDECKEVHNLGCAVYDDTTGDVEVYDSIHDGDWTVDGDEALLLTIHYEQIAE